MQAVEVRRELRRSEETRVKFWHVAIVSSFFIVVVGASLFLGAVMVIGTLRGNDNANELTADGRTGRFARTLRDGTLCHYIVFDNKTAQAAEDRIGRRDEREGQDAAAAAPHGRTIECRRSTPARGQRRQSGSYRQFGYRVGVAGVETQSDGFAAALDDRHGAAGRARDDDGVLRSRGGGGRAAVEGEAH